MISEPVRFIDQRTAQTALLRKALRYVFPDHWSFLLGEVALYAFIVLIATGIYLTLFFEPSTTKTVYDGSYAPLQGTSMTRAYESVVKISFDVPAGLLIRQTHHWAADVFVGAIILHLARILFTGAYRKGRELTYLIGLVMLMVTLLEGYLGYSLIDDLLSGMGLAIGYGVSLSIPFFGGNLAELIWGGPFPGIPAFWSRMYIGHVFLFPVLIATLLALHLGLVAARHHSQFRDARDQTERAVKGVPAFPGQAPRSLALMLAVAAVLFLMGGLIQINPIWQWGPFETGLSTNGAQPDWYLGWLIGALRLVPGFDLTIGDYTLVPNPFWGGALFPMVVFGILAVWPWAERRLTGDERFHNLLDRPRETPWRTGLAAALGAWVFMIFVAGSADRAYVSLDMGYIDQIWVYRVAVWVLPIVVAAITISICRGLQQSERVEREQRGAAAEARRPVGEPARRQAAD